MLSFLKTGPIPVKALRRAALLFLSFSFPLALANANPENYSEMLIKEAILWLPVFLNNKIEALPSQGERSRLFRDLLPYAVQLRKRALREINFRPTTRGFWAVDYDWSEPRLVHFFRDRRDYFILPGETEPRAATTGDSMNDPIDINEDLTGQFSYGRSLSLMVHEIGHKLKADRKQGANLSEDQSRVLQAAIDEAAIEMEATYGRYSFRDGNVFVVNGSRALLSVLHFSLLSDTGPHRPHNRFAIEQNGVWYDLWNQLNTGLDWIRYTRDNHIETERVITSVRWAKDSTPEHRHGFLQIDVSRLSKDYQKTHYMTDMGGPYPFQAEIQIEFGSDGPHLTVNRYGPIDNQIKPASGSSVEFKSWELSGAQFTAEIALHFRTEEYFHPGAYPTHYEAELVLFRDGQTRRVPTEIDAHWRKGGWNLMPHEAYKKDIVKLGRLTAEIPPDWADGFEVLGLVDRFFVLGGATLPPRLLIPIQETLIYEGPTDQGDPLPPCRFRLADGSGS